ncbi:MAG: DUF2207 domain-containing protein [Thermoguttaceae bacterium]
MKASLACSVCAGLLLACGAAPLVAASERILTFGSRTVIEPGGALTVCETIRVRAEGNSIRHGIYRDFPQYYRGWLGLNQTTGFTVIRVLRDGLPEPYRAGRHLNGMRVYIGLPDQNLPPGEHTYELAYRTERQLGFFSDHDELYWNATGNGWDFPIDQATAEVVLPQGAEATAATAYTGRSGARGRDFTSDTLSPGLVRFAVTRGLDVNEGLTIVVAWPKGFVAVPTIFDRWMDLIRDNPGTATAAGGLFLLLLYYALVRFDAAAAARRGTIIPLYGPPKNFSPAAVRYLMKFGFDNKTFAASLIDLAVKGAVIIHQTARRTFWRTEQEYSLQRRSLTVPDLTEEERIVLAKLLCRTDWLELRDTNHATIREARKALESSLAKQLENVYIARNLGYCGCGAVLSLVLLAVLGFECYSQFAVTQNVSIAVPALFAAALVINGVFYFLLRVPTPAGRKILDHILGFRRYLSIGERERLNLDDPPERTPRLFEMFLPYALAWDVEQKWAEQFAAVLAEARENPTSITSPYLPSWYDGDNWNPLQADTFTSSLGSSLASVIASSVVAPGSSSGIDGGGSFDCGSCGAGGGGGGGGGW